MKLVEKLSVARVLALLVVGLLASACGVEVVGGSDQGEGCEGADCVEASACDGDDPAGFCDDCNPCTADANCTPCSELPEDERDMRHCTRDDQLPAFCAGKRGCVHEDVSAAAGETNGCFPVAGDDDLHAGSCRAGVCVENVR